jgi:hypothetical protein
MITTIMSSVLTTAIVASSTFCSIPSASVPFTRTLPEKNLVAQNVPSDKTLGDFAQEQYGDANQWTTVWNDNPWIENPDVVKKDWILAVRAEKPAQPEELVTSNAMKADVIESTSESTSNVAAANSAAKQVQLVQYIQPTVQPVASQAPTDSPKILSDDQINYLGSCEAGMDPAKNTGNGYYGAFQFSYGTWKSMGTGYERADLAPIEVQKAAVQRLVQRSSIHTQFPGCASKMRGAGLI